MAKSFNFVIPAKAGIQRLEKSNAILDPRFRGDDEVKAGMTPVLDSRLRGNDGGKC